MKEARLTLTGNRLIAARCLKMTLEGDVSAFSRSGQFLELAIPGFYLRRPFSVSSFADGRLEIVYKTVGKGTDAMSRMVPGDSLDALLGLGNGFSAGECRRAALLLGGGVGTAPLVQLARELSSAGKEVTAVLGFNEKSETILVEELEASGAKVLISTLDGSEGTKGMVTDVLKQHSPSFDYWYACGPKPMLKALCSALDTPGELSLEERMGCGFGICYGCSVQTASGPRRVCKDGPVFKKEELIW